MATDGIVRCWDDDAGWGVIDTAETPGGCWAHFSAIALDGFRTLHAGQQVSVIWERAEQDGYAFRAVVVDPQIGQSPSG